MKKYKIAITSAILFSSMSLFAVDISIETKYQQSQMDGDIKIGVVGTNINVGDTFNIDSEAMIVPKISLEWDKHIIALEYSKVEYKGSGELVEDIIFNNKTYTVGSNTDFNLEKEDIAFDYKYKLISNDDFNLNLGTKINYLKLNTSIENVFISESKEVEVILPILTIGAKYNINKSLSIDGDIGYIAYENNSYLDASVNINYEIYKGLASSVGYRIKKVEYDLDDDQGSVDFSGMNAGISYTF